MAPVLCYRPHSETMQCNAMQCVQRGPIEPKQIDKKPLNESYAKAPSKSAVKEENNAGAKEATADPKVKAATPKIFVLNVGKVLDQDINTETVNFDTKLVALSLVADLPKSPAYQVKRVPVPVPKRTRSRDDVEFETETTGDRTFKDFMHTIVNTN